MFGQFSLLSDIVSGELRKILFRPVTVAPAVAVTVAVTAVATAAAAVASAIEAATIAAVVAVAVAAAASVFTADVYCCTFMQLPTSLLMVTYFFQAISVVWSHSRIP